MGGMKATPHSQAEADAAATSDNPTRQKWTWDASHNQGTGTRVGVARRSYRAGMSLTSLLDDQHGPIREWFEERLPNLKPMQRAWKAAGPVTIPPILRGGALGQVGAALDYRIRYWFEVFPLERWRGWVRSLSITTPPCGQRLTSGSPPSWPGSSRSTIPEASSSMRTPSRSWRGCATSWRSTRSTTEPRSDRTARPAGDALRFAAGRPGAGRGDRRHHGAHGRLR